MTVKHLLKNPITGRLSYRRIYPVELRPFIAGSPRELKRSLKASRIEDPTAVSAYQTAHIEYEATIVAARKKLEGRFDKLDPPMIAYLAAKLKQEWLAEDDRVRMAADDDLLYRRINGMEHFQLEFIDWRNRLSRDDIVEYWEADAHRLLASNGLTIDPEGHDTFAQLCVALNASGIEAAEALIRRYEGSGYTDTPAAPERPSHAPSAPMRAPLPIASGLPFDALAIAYMEAPQAAVTVNTRDSIKTALRYFKEVHRDPTPQEITRRMVTEWLDLMAQRPTPLRGTEKNLTLPELATRYNGRQEVRRMASDTRKKYVGALSTCWQQMQSRGEIPEDLSNPFKGHNVGPASTSSAVKGLSVPEMQSIFDLPIFTAGERPKQGRGEASYWMPLLLLWTGARPEEVAQLLVADIFQDDETDKWMIRFTDEGEHPVKPRQTLKTSRFGSGRRTFPVPSALIALGLLDYVEHLKAAGNLALFPRLTLKRPKRGELFPSYGSWWSIYIHKAGILPKGRRAAKEFRHSWTTAARACGVDQVAMEYIQGHSTVGRGMNAHYGHREVLGQQIEKVTFKGLDLSRVLQWEPLESP